MITDKKIAKTATLLLSAGHTGGAILELSDRTESFTGELVMLTRSFLEKVTNFCYASICDDKEYRAFILHPIYKHYHIIGEPRTLRELGNDDEKVAARKKEQESLRKLPIVQEALAIFSETKPNLRWTKTTVEQRIGVIRKWGEMLDDFFFLSWYQYFSDASEALHGSLYGCTFHTGVFAPGFGHVEDKEEAVNKKLYKESTCVLLQMGMLIHESFTLISYSSDIGELWKHSYDNRGNALNLLFHVQGVKVDETE